MKVDIDLERLVDLLKIQRLHFRMFRFAEARLSQYDKEVLNSLYHVLVETSRQIDIQTIKCGTAPFRCLQSEGDVCSLIKFIDPFIELEIDDNEPYDTKGTSMFDLIPREVVDELRIAEEIRRLRRKKAQQARKKKLKEKAMGKAKTATKSKAADKAKTTTKSKAADKAKTTTKSKAADKAKTATKSKAADKAKTATKSKATNKAKTTTKSKAADKAKTTTKSKAADKAKTTTKSKAADKAKTATKSKANSAEKRKKVAERKA